MTVQQVILNVATNSLFVAFNPIVVIKMDAENSVIQLQKIVYQSTTYQSHTTWLFGMEYSPMYDLLCFYVSESHTLDHYFHVSAADLTSNR